MLISSDQKLNTERTSGQVSGAHSPPVKVLPQPLHYGAKRPRDFVSESFFKMLNTIN
jgi:hypothetical protein